MNISKQNIEINSYLRIKWHEKEHGIGLVFEFTKACASSDCGHCSLKIDQSSTTLGLCIPHSFRIDFITVSISALEPWTNEAGLISDVPSGILFRTYIPSGAPIRYSFILMTLTD
jgi:succinate dehydrogenase/fumarate reductase-like Fe-S protein